MSTSIEKLLRKAERSGTLRYRDCLLEEIQHRYAPRKVFQNDDGTCTTYIIHPLPTEGEVTFQIPQSQLINRNGFLINLISYMPSHDRHLRELLHIPVNQTFYLIFGRLTECNDQTPLSNVPSHFRLSLDHYKLDESDAVQVIIPHHHTIPSWFSTTEPSDVLLTTYAKHYSRLILSPLESYEFWLLPYTKDLRLARQKFINDYREYILDSL